MLARLMAPTFLALAFLAAPLTAETQPAGKIPRMGYLSTGSATWNPFVEAFRQGLRETGWIEGQNIAIEYRYAENRFDRLPDLAAELARLKVDVIVAAPTPSAVAAKRATETIPIVMINAADPVGLGLIASLGRPGGNITGLSFSVGLETLVKGLEFIKETLPTVRRVAVLSNPANPAQRLAIMDLKVGATSPGVQLQLLEARGPDEFDGAFAAMAKERVGALLVLADSTLVVHRTRLADLAARDRLPAAYGVREHCGCRRPHVLRTEPHREGPRPHDPAVAARAGG